MNNEFKAIIGIMRASNLLVGDLKKTLKNRMNTQFTQKHYLNMLKTKLVLLLKKVQFTNLLLLKAKLI